MHEIMQPRPAILFLPLLKYFIFLSLIALDSQLAGFQVAFLAA